MITWGKKKKALLLYYWGGGGGMREGMEKGILKKKYGYARECLRAGAGITFPDTPLAIKCQKAILQCERAL